MARKQIEQDSVFDGVDGDLTGPEQQVGLVRRTLKPEEAELVEVAGEAIKSFFKRATAFFIKADDFELRAKETLARMKARPAPTTEAEDADLQVEVRRSNADMREIEAHYEITAQITRLRNQITGKRKIAIDALTDASKIGNAQHNVFVQTAARVAAVEQEMLRAKAEREAIAVRTAELAKLEADALAQEAALEGLSDREHAFVVAVLEGHAPHAAAERAGFKDAVKRGGVLVSTPKIIQAIEAARAAEATRRQAAAVRALPVDPVYVPVVAPAVTKATGSRTYKGAKCLDVDAFRTAFMAGKHGIPADIWVVDEAKLNGYGKSLGDLVNLWPGCQATSDTKIV